MTPIKARLRYGHNPHHLRNKLNSQHACPGHIGHDHPRNELVFEHWVHRGNKAYAFYWRLHRAEYRTKDE